MSLETVFGLIIGAGFVLIIGFVIFSLIKTQLPQEIDESTLSSFEEITNTVKQIESGAIDKKTVVVDVREPFTIIGFNKFESIQIEKIVQTWSETLVKDFILRVFPADNILSPCSPYKTCLCICSYKESLAEKISYYATPALRYLFKGKKLRYLDSKACFGNKKNCVEFDDLILKGKNSVYKDYILIIPVNGNIIIEGNKTNINIDYSNAKNKLGLLT